FLTRDSTQLNSLGALDERIITSFMILIIVEIFHYVLNSMINNSIAEEYMGEVSQLIKNANRISNKNIIKIIRNKIDETQEENFCTALFNKNVFAIFLLKYYTRTVRQKEIIYIDENKFLEKEANLLKEAKILKAVKQFLKEAAKMENEKL
ncbi:hypothetical protein RhiirC2_713038, partial [Rhizophagus irregularis]